LLGVTFPYNKHVWIMRQIVSFVFSLLCQIGACFFIIPTGSSK
jgi:hypothetical protein